MDVKGEAKVWWSLKYSLGRRVIEKKTYMFLLATSLILHCNSFSYNEVGVHRFICLKGLNFLFNGN